MYIRDDCPLPPGSSIYASAESPERIRPNEARRSLASGRSCSDTSKPTA